jgi:hypothetical protein
LIRIKAPLSLIGENASGSGEVMMPYDAMLVCAAVVAMFTVFAVVLLWGDYQTRPSPQKEEAQLQPPQQRWAA